MVTILTKFTGNQIKANNESKTTQSERYIYLVHCRFGQNGHQMYILTMIISWEEMKQIEWKCRFSLMRWINSLSTKKKTLNKIKNLSRRTYQSAVSTIGQWLSIKICWSKNYLLLSLSAFNLVLLKYQNIFHEGGRTQNGVH